MIFFIMMKTALLNYLKICLSAQRNCVTPERSNGICSQLNNCPQVLSAHRARNQQYVTATQRACGGNLVSTVTDKVDHVKVFPNYFSF